MGYSPQSRKESNTTEVMEYTCILMFGSILAIKRIKSFKLLNI